jgi:hypothetical protein
VTRQAAVPPIHSAGNSRRTSAIGNHSVSEWSGRDSSSYRAQEIFGAFVLGTDQDGEEAYILRYSQASPQGIHEQVLTDSLCLNFAIHCQPSQSRNGERIVWKPSYRH